LKALSSDSHQVLNASLMMAQRPSRQNYVFRFGGFPLTLCAL